MKIYDFNIHLPTLKNTDVNEVIGEDLHLTFSGLVNSFNTHLPFLKKNTGGNFMLFNVDLFDDLQHYSVFKNSIEKDFLHHSFTALIDFRRKDIINYMEVIKDFQIHFIMFNSYLQKITPKDFNQILTVCKYAEENGIKICIDASYGTSKMYTYDNLLLACYISDHITNVPIVIIHSGGKRILEAMLLADEKKNVYLDTSFSLPYYIGSSIEIDMAYAYKKIGTDKVFFGSDFPYLNSENSIQIHLDFFNKYSFSSDDIDKIMFKNALNVIA